MLSIDAWIERWPLAQPFGIAGQVFTEAELLRVAVTGEDTVGHGEAAGVYFLGETGATMLADVAALGGTVRPDRAALGSMPAGGARNALDLALWDWQARRSGIPVWRRIGLAPAPVATTVTIGLTNPDTMASQAAAAGAPRIKLKLGGAEDARILLAIRQACPEATLLVDVNGGWDMPRLRGMLPVLIAAGVSLLEQPLPPGADDALSALAAPVPIAADESVHTRSDLPRLADRYQYVNIKLDKAGGLTEALALAAAAHAAGLGIMVGCMECTSLGLAPAVLLGAGAAFADLDGAWLLARDRPGGFVVRDGTVQLPPVLPWGDPSGPLPDRARDG